MSQPNYARSVEERLLNFTGLSSYKFIFASDLLGNSKLIVIFHMGNLKLIVIFNMSNSKLIIIFSMGNS